MIQKKKIYSNYEFLGYVIEDKILSKVLQQDNKNVFRHPNGKIKFQRLQSIDDSISFNDHSGLIQISDDKSPKIFAKLLVFSNLLQILFLYIIMIYKLYYCSNIIYGFI